jgi:hypothetical protein
MSYLLSKEQLVSSAYYCAAGIDLQPILRFGDFIDDFIYVSLDISEQDLRNGIAHCVNSINDKLTNCELTINEVKKITLKDIEHPVQDLLIRKKPEYMNDADLRNYFNAINQFYHLRNEYYLLFELTLKLGKISRKIRLFHLTGEALAVYEAFFRNQQIAPKIFISIQSGAIEIPTLFSNRMFEMDTERPKVWVRGVWEIPQRELFTFSHKDVFNQFGIYNTFLSEYRNWEANFNFEISGATDNQKTIRIVQAYGEKSFWQREKYDEKLETSHLEINKLLKAYNGTFASNYTAVKIQFQFSQLDQLYLEYKVFCETNSTATEFKVAILPFGYELYEGFIAQFMECFIPINGINLTIDIYYVNLLDSIRNF